MDKKIISKSVAEAAGKTTKLLAVSTLVVFGIGLVASIISDKIERSEMKERLKRYENKN